MKLKLDLHTHVWEAFNFQPPSLEIAEQVVRQIKAAGIDGIGITDHHNKDWSFEFRELVEQHFPGEVVIIPGWEIEVRPEQNPFAEYQVAELFLPPMDWMEGGTFRTYCHPGYYSPEIIIEQNIHAIEIDNYIHNWHIRKPLGKGEGGYSRADPDGGQRRSQPGEHWSAIHGGGPQGPVRACSPARGRPLKMCRYASLPNPDLRKGRRSRTHFAGPPRCSQCLQRPDEG